MPLIDDSSTLASGAVASEFGPSLDTLAPDVRSERPTRELGDVRFRGKGECAAVRGMTAAVSRCMESASASKRAPGYRSPRANAS